MARTKVSKQRQRPQQQTVLKKTAATTTATPAMIIPGVSTSKRNKMARRLQELEDEKAKLEQMLRILNLRRKVVDPTLKQPVIGRVAVAPAPAAAKPVRSHKKKSRKDTPSDEEVSVHNQSEVSSLQSVGASRAGHHEDDYSEDYEEDDEDELSVMTEDMYHYDARGRRVTDDDYYHMEDNESVAACYQQITGRQNNNDSDSDRSTAHGNHKSTSKRKKSSSNSPEPRVMIEWKRGKSYKPAANLAFDNGEIYNHHPTDLSLMVNDDKSFFDDLSFSSGDDSILKAAFTDMPMEIDFDLGSDDDSVNSGLHSECSVSVAAAPYQKEMSSKSKKLPPKSSKKPSKQAPNPSQFLYNKLDASEQSHEEEKQQPSKNNKHKSKFGGKEEDLPPPLTTDMSLLEQQRNVNKSKQKEFPPEISCSQLSVEESLGSEMGGVSLTPESPPAAAPTPMLTQNGKSKGTKDTKGKESSSPTKGNAATATAPTNGNNKKTKKKKSKGKQTEEKEGNNSPKPAGGKGKDKNGNSSSSPKQTSKIQKKSSTGTTSKKRGSQQEEVATELKKPIPNTTIAT